MSDPVRCPACGHELSRWRPPPETAGERGAMWIAAHVASWWFPLTVVALLAGWVVVNVTARPFEPYPVIVYAVISAVLATVSALQGPLILLAQRRSADRDRQRDDEALRVAVNTEADLHRLEAKVDRLLARLDQATPD